jgi:short-subunit dehydrogenase
VRPDQRNKTCAVSLQQNSDRGTVGAAGAVSTERKESIQRRGGTGPAATRGAVLVTGGSEGIGLALARHFLEKRHSVVLVARHEARLGAALEALWNAKPKGCALVAVAQDVIEDDAYGTLVQRLAAEGLHIDILINNAAMGLGGTFASHEPAAIDRLVALNIAAQSRLMHGAIQDMRRRGCGHIINMASLGGYVPGPYQAAYYASKAYAISLSEAVDAELRGSGVRVSVVAPGPVDTDFHASMGAEDAYYRRLLPSMTPEQVAASVYRGYRLGLCVIVPGMLNRIMGVALRVLPHPIAVPLTGWLLKPRAK